MKISWKHRTKYFVCRASVVLAAALTTGTPLFLVSNVRAQTAPVLPGQPPAGEDKDEPEDGKEAPDEEMKENQAPGENGEDENQTPKEQEKAPEEPVQVILSDTLDEDTKGITPQNATDSLEIVREKENLREGTGALSWKYTLAPDKPSGITVDAGLPLSAARSVRFWMRSSVAAPYSLFFQETGAGETPGARYEAAFWSIANTWQEIEIGLDRFSLAADSTDANNMPDWNSMPHYGLIDATNEWNRALGQTRVSGARQVGLDHFQVTTKTPSNPQSVAQGEDTEPILLVQDGLGDARLWIRNDGQISDSPEGFKWNYTRLANRVMALAMPVNGAAFEIFPEKSIDPDAPPETGLIAKRSLLLILEVASQKPTRLNVAVTERNGAVYSTKISIDPRRRLHRQALALARFKPEGIRRDDNKQLDFAQIKTLTISDVAAQSGQAGPNQLEIGSVLWSY